LGTLGNFGGTLKNGTLGNLLGGTMLPDLGEPIGPVFSALALEAE
jgi:hypothetical protein